MDNIVIILTSILTIVLVVLLVPLIMSARQKAEIKAIDDKCICYPSISVKVLWITTGVALLLTVIALVCTILSIINPEMMDTTADDTIWIILTWVLCIALDAFTIVFSIMFMRTITYNNDSFTDIKFCNKKHEYFYKDITKIESTVRANPTYTAYGAFEGRKGKLKVYFGERCVKIPANMLGVTEFISLLQTQRPNLFIN
ncbi:MAG: hypothetical protein K2I75_06445 [Clostridiales bacterium]|nr:hypothetical protein [Clostridiales bacterium]